MRSVDGYALPSQREKPGSWVRQALCRNPALTPLFFSMDGEDQREALQICECCPVREPCLEFACRNRINDGVWGGTLEVDRRRTRWHLRLARARAEEMKAKRRIT